MGDDAVAAGEVQADERGSRFTAASAITASPHREEANAYIDRQVVGRPAPSPRPRGGVAAVRVRRPPPIAFQLNWVAGGANAGFASALAEGYYKDAGLDVTIVQGNGSGNTAQLVASGRSQLAYADAVAISQLIAKGAPMKVVSTSTSRIRTQVMALKKTGIKSIKDLAGKKVGVPSGSSQTTMLPLFLKANNLKEIGHDADRTCRRRRWCLRCCRARSMRSWGRSTRTRSRPRRRARSSTSTASPTMACPRSARRSSSATATSRTIRTSCRKFIAASLKGWSFALDNPDRR